MRQEQIVKKPRRRKTRHRESTPLTLRKAPNHLAQAEAVLVEIDRLLERAS